MQEFGKLHFENVAYINFDDNPRMKNLFENDFDIPRIIDGLSLETKVNIKAGKTLLIFDEVQEVPRALTSLKYFDEKAPEYAVMAAGSLLGVALHEGTSFPVGKVQFYNLYPLTYCEFLEAMGEEKLVDLLKGKDWELIKVFESKFIDYLRKYFYIGGMPRVINAYIDERDYFAVRDMQERLLLTYREDFSKHVPTSTIPRVRMVWDNIPEQLAKEKRWTAKMLRENSRLKDYEFAIQWLADCGLIHKVQQITKAAVPLAAYQGNFFKLYMLDVGLLAALSGLEAKTILEGNKIFQEFKGALTEQYAMQELVSKGIEPYYWTTRSQEEVDFAFQKDGKIYPLEVKAEKNTQGKSLRCFSQRFNLAPALRTSMHGYADEGWLINIPLYALGVNC
jgi:predicted AAA+ superfamily ATPase